MSLYLWERDSRSAVRAQIGQSVTSDGKTRNGFIRMRNALRLRGAK